MAVKLYSERSFCENVSLDAVAVCFAHDKLIDQQRSFPERLSSTDQVLRNKVRYFVAKTEDRRWLDSYQWRIRCDHILEQLNVLNCEFLCVT